jgi:hypothetical protein
MSFWLREVAGWFFLGLSLWMIYMIYVFSQRHWWLEAWAWAFLTVFVYRGAIHLLKVAVAARVCRQAQDRLYPAPETGNRRRLP